MPSGNPPRHVTCNDPRSNNEEYCRAKNGDHSPHWVNSTYPLKSDLPFGNRILLVIGLVSTQGGAPQELLSENRSELGPTWSHDGSRSLLDARMSRNPKLSTFLTYLRFSFPCCRDPRALSVPAGRRTAWQRSPRLAKTGAFVLFDFKTQKWTDSLSATPAPRKSTPSTCSSRKSRVYTNYGS